jgi:AhpD family alkylhydroperoxidase
MTRRYAINKFPDAYRALTGVETYARDHVDKQVLHLLKLRASMINGCAFCLDMHTREALADGEDIRRLMALGAWWEAPFFDAGERAALALTDEVTRLGEHGVSDETWAGAVEHWGEEGAVNLVVAIGMINLWNRIAVTARAQPPV